jgi:hypothetical protein
MPLASWAQVVIGWLLLSYFQNHSSTVSVFFFICCLNSSFVE